MSPDAVPGRWSCSEGTSSSGSRSLDLDKVVLMFAALVVAFDVWYVNCAQLLVLPGTVGAQGIRIEISRGRCQFCKLSMCLSLVNLSVCVLQALCSCSCQGVQSLCSCSSHGVQALCSCSCPGVQALCSCSSHGVQALCSCSSHGAP